MLHGVLPQHLTQSRTCTTHTDTDTASGVPQYTTSSVVCCMYCDMMSWLSPTLSSGSPNSPTQGRSMRPITPKMYLQQNGTKKTSPVKFTAMPQHSKMAAQASHPSRNMAVPDDTTYQSHVLSQPRHRMTHPGVRRCGRLQRMDDCSGFTRTRSPSLNLCDMHTQCIE